MKIVYMKDFCTTTTNFNYFISIGFHNSKKCKAKSEKVGKKKKKKTVCMERTDVSYQKKYLIRHQAAFGACIAPYGRCLLRGEIHHGN